MLRNHFGWAWRLSSLSCFFSFYFYSPTARGGPAGWDRVLSGTVYVHDLRLRV